MGHLLSLAQAQNFKLTLDADFLFLYPGPWGHQHLKGDLPLDLSIEGGEHDF